MCASASRRPGSGAAASRCPGTPGTMGGLGWPGILESLVHPLNWSGMDGTHTKFRKPSNFQSCAPTFLWRNEAENNALRRRRAQTPGHKLTPRGETLQNTHGRLVEKGKKRSFFFFFSPKSCRGAQLQHRLPLSLSKTALGPKRAGRKSKGQD